MMGKLSFAAEAQQLGRAFLGHLSVDLREAESAGRTHVTLSANALRELTAWSRLLERAVATASLTRPLARSIRRYMTDASTTVGIAGAWLDGDTLRLHMALRVHASRGAVHRRLVTKRGRRAHHATRAAMLPRVRARMGVQVVHVEFAGDNSASCAMVGQQGARADKSAPRSSSTSPSGSAPAAPRSLRRGSQAP
jgi:hypothetical protein